MAVMLREILGVLEVQRRERHFVSEAADGDPHVVDWPGPPAQGGFCGQAAQTVATASSPGRTGVPESQPASFLAAVRAPVADLGPLGELAERHEGDERVATDQARGQRRGELAPV
jgi:hypothetical protein